MRRLFDDSTVFYDWSGGMESSAMLVIDRERIRQTGAIVRWANTGKYIEEMAASKAQIESILDLSIVEVPRAMTFDEFLFERGGMIRKGTTDCSRRMKRANLARHLKTFPKPWEVNLGYNSAEVQRAEEFIDLNERPFCHWRFPLIEAGISREQTWDICRNAGFSVLIWAYETFGRFDCYFCGNQRPSQALKLIEYKPHLAAEWYRLETLKGHSFMPVSIAQLAIDNSLVDKFNQPVACACFGGTENVLDDEELVSPPPQSVEESK